jgi:hypothetical protein
MSFRPYQTRYLFDQGLKRIGDWRLKQYGIRMDKNGEALDWSKLDQLWPEWSQSAQDHYHIGFVIWHQASDGNWILCNWWTGGEMLHTQTYHLATIDSQPVARPEYGSMACVWELPVIWHERQSWIRHVLQQAQRPQMEAYLVDYLKEINP